MISAHNFYVIKTLFGKRITTLRKANGLTQEQLAESSGYSVEFISFIERGKNGPSLEGIKRLARALAVTEADLFNFTEESMR